MPSHSTPAGVVTEYFETLRWLTLLAQTARSSTETRRAAAMSVVYAVTALEVFLNLWFRVYAIECTPQEVQAEFEQSLGSKVTLDQKLSKWPMLLLKKKMDLKVGPGGALMALKAKRNSIVHFESTNDTIHASNIIIHCLADTSEYDSLSAMSAVEAVATTEAFVLEIFRLAGFDDKTCEQAQAVWIGKQTASSSIDRGPAPWIAPHVTR
jgi:hypothetical protein